MKNSDTLLVGFDHSHGDIAVLIIGRKDAGENVQIINQFQGKEAEELYERLVTKRRFCGWNEHEHKLRNAPLRS